MLMDLRQRLQECSDELWETIGRAQATAAPPPSLDDGQRPHNPDIEQAKLILAARLGISPGDAFQVLRQVSQDVNIKVRDIASVVVLASP